VRDAYPFGLAAALIAFADAIAYLVLISREDTTNNWGRVALVAALILVAGLLAAAGSVVTGRRRATMLWPATAILLVIGFLGIFSIGLPLLIAGILTAGGAASAMRGRPQSRRPAPRPRSESSQP
jgi:hypothetical protein